MYNETCIFIIVATLTAGEGSNSTGISSHEKQLLCLSENSVLAKAVLLIYYIAGKFGGRKVW